MPPTKSTKAIENAHYLEIINRLESLAKAQQETNEKLSRREYLDGVILEHDKHIKGNGKPGLLERVAIAEEREAKRDRREWFLYCLILTELVGIALLYVKG